MWHSELFNPFPLCSFRKKCLSLRLYQGLREFPLALEFLPWVCVQVTTTGFHSSFGGSAVPTVRRVGGQCLQLGWDLLMDKPAMKTKYGNQNLLCRGLRESRHSCEPAWLCWLSQDSQENAWIGKLEARAGAARAERGLGHGEL